MSIDERPLQTEPTPSTTLARSRGGDTVAIVTALVASVAMMAALVALGFALRAVEDSNRSLRQANAAAARTATVATAPTVVGIGERNFAFTLAQTTAPAGLIDLNVTNNGPSAHELLIFQTELAPDKLPLGPDGRVNEGGDSITKVFDSGNNIDPGTTKTFHVALVTGNYVIVCNLPGHYKAGMYTAFTVH
jgi:uncharacterized cupredoxin-like copper-binding protein